MILSWIERHYSHVHFAIILSRKQHIFLFLHTCISIYMRKIALWTEQFYVYEMRIVNTNFIENFQHVENTLMFFNICSFDGGNCILKIIYNVCMSYVRWFQINIDQTWWKKSNLVNYKYHIKLFQTFWCESCINCSFHPLDIKFWEFPLRRERDPFQFVKCI